MNVMTHRGLLDGDARSLIDDPKKRAEDQAQLAGEEESRSRRIQNRKASRFKSEMARKAKRRARAFKLVGFWCFAIVAGFLSIAWFAPELAANFG